MTSRKFMKRHPSLVVVVLAVAASTVAASEFQSPDLRSAYLLRANPELAAANQVPATPEELQAELRRHFIAVLNTLQSQSETSLAQALQRLEAAQRKVATETDANSVWDSSMRQRWYDILQSHRALQIERLREYAQAGKFPTNELRPERRVPVFVDERDNICAVGYLMRTSERNSTSLQSS